MSTIASRNKLIKTKGAFAASILGAKGGAVKSEAKAKAARKTERRADALERKKEGEQMKEKAFLCDFSVEARFFPSWGA